MAECCIADEDGTIGAEIELSKWSVLPLRALLFGEAQARIIVSTPESGTVLELARKHGVPARVIGQVRGRDDGLRIRIGARALYAPLERLPNAALAAIVFFIGVRMIDVRDLRQIYHARKLTFGVAIATMLAVVTTDAAVDLKDYGPALGRRFIPEE